MVNICDVYDLENKKILSQKTFAEISEILNISQKSVANSFYRGSRVGGVYLVVKSMDELQEEEYRNSNSRLILEEWEKVVKPFKNVEWVKSYSYGTKVLGARKA